jgi:hypothetical protein
MSLIEFNRDPSPGEVRQFARVWLPALCLVIAVWATLRLANGAAVAFAGVGLVALILGVLRPEWLRPVYLVWTAAAYPLGWLLAHVLLAGTYFLLITPIGLILRLTRRDPLARRFDRESESYWTPRPERTDPERYFQQF